MKGPWRITFDTNPDTCNLYCIMCEEHSRFSTKKGEKNRIMDPEMIVRVIESAAPYGLKEIIPSTMGEPLLYPHFETLLDTVREYGLRINLTTNGTFPGKGAKKWAEVIMPFASDIKVSINSSKPKTNSVIMEGLDSQKQLSNISELIAVRDEVRKRGENNPTITFQATYLEQNLEDLPGLLEMAIEMDIDRFKGHHLWITNDEMKKESLKKSETSIQRWNKISQELHDIRNKHLKKDGTRIVLDNVYLLQTNPEMPVNQEMHCPFTEKEAWIAWDGTFNVCCAPDKQRRTFGNFGNVKEIDFMELWQSTKYKEFTRQQNEKSVCQKCNMRCYTEEKMGCDNE